MTWRWKIDPYADVLFLAQAKLERLTSHPKVAEQDLLEERGSRLLAIARAYGLSETPADLADLVFIMDAKHRTKSKRTASDPRRNEYEQLVIDFATERDRFPCAGTVRCGCGCDRQKPRCPRTIDATLKRLLETETWRGYSLKQLRAQLTEARKIGTFYAIIDEGYSIEYFKRLRTIADSSD